MSKGVKIMMFAALVLPAFITIFRIILDYFLGREMEWMSYSTVFFGSAVGGLFFAGPLMYTIFKTKEN
ncbi:MULTISPECIES: hypothetical protein [Oceanobacillus]|uniref:Uncharacterized protein n=1 Tax=Oceanobacillus kimchii TaxID=746691 RepID=A0ABQ5TQH9_9BACI|nr:MULTISPECIES: hypothetical protein [Oceanobacillus]MBT2600002.1 hypothetical protein [Oceanobacillus sp. ISL-74]MBT2652550.1 hypothetical protein [Oceanobacillus sp. ISL-73]GLO68126.1 hypothetical protein MACH08_39100 [Oceanobacillus kimchii]